MPQETGDIGNLLTEDIVNMLNRAGIDTQLNTNLVSETANKIASLLNITSKSHISYNKSSL